MESLGNLHAVARWICYVGTVLGAGRLHWFSTYGNASDLANGTLGTIHRQLPLLLGKTCLVRYTAGSASHHSRHHAPELLQTLSSPVELTISLVMSDAQLLTLQQVDWTSPQLVLCSRALFRFAIEVLSWPLDNKALLLVLEDTGVSAWDVYRAGNFVPAVPQRLGSVSMPLLQEEIQTLRRERWFRRSNLTGLTLRCMSGDYPPFSMTLPQLDGSIALSGYVGDVWNILEQHLHFKSECRAPSDGLWGSYDPATSSAWNGMLGHLQDETTDVVAGPFLHNLIRGKFFDFSNALYSSWSAVIVQKPRSSRGGSDYTRAFSARSWLAIGATFVFFVLLMKFFSSHERTFQSWSDYLLEHIRIFCSMGYHGECRTLISFRIWLLTELLTVVLLSVFYTCFLTTFLSVNRSKLPIESLEDIYERRNHYSLGLTKDTSIVDRFKFSINDDVLIRNIWEEMISINPRNLATERENIERSLADSRHISIMDNDFYTSKFKDCRLTVLPRKYFKASVGFPLRKDLPVKQIINYWILKLSESGSLQQLLARWQRTARREEQCAASASLAMGLPETYTAFLLLGTGLLLSGVVLLGEWTHYYSLKRAQNFHTYSLN